MLGDLVPILLLMLDSLDYHNAREVGGDEVGAESALVEQDTQPMLHTAGGEVNWGSSRAGIPDVPRCPLARVGLRKGSGYGLTTGSGVLGLGLGGNPSCYVYTLIAH